MLRSTALSGYTSKSANRLRRIQASDGVVSRVMRTRVDFEQVLSLVYVCGDTVGGGYENAEGLRRYALNLPYRYCRWLEAQATGEPIVVKVPRDSSPGEKPGATTGDAQTGEYVARIITRALYEAQYEGEINAVIGECCGRGVSFLGIGYHEEAISRTVGSEVGKDAQSVVVDVLGQGQTEAVPGQANKEIADGLRTMAGDQVVQAQIGMKGLVGLLNRAGSHDFAQYKNETDRSTVAQVRDIRRRVWVRKLRAGEDVFWDMTVADIKDARWMARRHVCTKSEFNANPLFTAKAKETIHGQPDPFQSGVIGGGQTASGAMMSPDARAAAVASGEDTSDWLVEWFEVYERRPDMMAGGIRYALSAEMPDDVISESDEYPYVDEDGFCAIPNFYPFFDFAPLKPPMHQPERTLGIPLVAPGWTQFLKLMEFNRLRVESARKHSLRAYQLHPALKGEKKILDKFQNGEDGFAFFCPPSLMGADGKMQEAVIPIQFSGNTQQIDVQAAREYADWIRVQGMPPAHVEGVGQAETATQEQIGVAAGDSEMQSLVKRLEARMADVCEGIRGLIRAFYDSEDIVELLGAEGGEAIKTWKMSSMKGDRLQVVFGLRAKQADTVAKKQLMESITLVQGNVDPATTLPIYDAQPLYQELFRALGVGKPQLNASMLAQLQQLAMIGQQVLMAQQKAQAGGGQPGAGGGQQQSAGGGGPNPSEGSGPSPANIESGARNGTVKRPYPTAA